MAMMQVTTQMAEPTNIPSQKTLAATGGSAVGAALATILLFWWDPANTWPQNVHTAVTVLISAATTFAAGYLTPPNRKEAVVTDAAGNVQLARAA